MRKYIFKIIVVLLSLITTFLIITSISAQNKRELRIINNSPEKITVNAILVDKIKKDLRNSEFSNSIGELELKSKDEYVFTISSISSLKIYFNYNENKNIDIEIFNSDDVSNIQNITQNTYEYNISKLNILKNELSNFSVNDILKWSLIFIMIVLINYLLSIVKDETLKKTIYIYNFSYMWNDFINSKINKMSK